MARGCRSALVLVAVCLLSTGCAGMRPGAVLNSQVVTGIRTSVIPPGGVLYTHYKAPITTGFDPSRSLASKRGEAVVRQIALPPMPFPGLATGLDLVSWGDASIKQAAANGGITDVEHVDYELKTVLMVFRKFTVEVYGD